MRLVGFIIRIYYDVRSSEFQIRVPLCSNLYTNNAACSENRIML